MLYTIIMYYFLWNTPLLLFNMSHTGGLQQFISHIHALGIPLQQQKQLSLI